MARGRSNQKVANGLVVMSSAAVLAVYSAGYVRTRSAADRIAEQTFARSFARQTQPLEAGPDGPPAAPMPAISAHPDPKRNIQQRNIQARSAAVAPKPTTSSAPVPSVAAATVPAETPAPVAAPASASVTSFAAAAEAPATIPAAAPAAPSPSAWKDGKYVAWGGCRHGDIEATVVIDGGRIVSAEISNCQTRYSCDIIDKLPPQVIKRQSPNVDRIGGATESADAFYSAVYFALKQAN